jgi:hypothetical protein
MSYSNIYNSGKSKSHYGSGNSHLLTYFRRAVLTCVLAHYTYNDGAQHNSGSRQTNSAFSQYTLLTMRR